jgi:hypothetical protein
VVADDSDYLIAEAENAVRVRKAVDAHLARSAVTAPATADPAERADSAPAPRDAEPAPSSPREGERPRLVVSVDPVNVLDAALNAAADDVARGALLASAPKHVREALAALWGYRAFMKAAPDPYDEFERALAAAANDGDRATLIAGRSPEFLVEWAWRTRATADDWRRRYLALTSSENEAG